MTHGPCSFRMRAGEIWAKRWSSHATVAGGKGSDERGVSSPKAASYDSTTYHNPPLTRWLCREKTEQSDSVVDETVRGKCSCNTLACPESCLVSSGRPRLRCGRWPSPRCESRRVPPANDIQRWITSMDTLIQEDKRGRTCAERSNGA